MVGRYRRWLARQPTAARTRAAYLSQVDSYVDWLVASGYDGAVVTVASARDGAVRAYKRSLKVDRGWKPSSVNQALAAIDNFYRTLPVGVPHVAREALAQLAPRALDQAEQRAFVRAVERCPVARDRAIATVFLQTGLRLSELSALKLDDVSISARRGQLRVRSGKGDRYREVPLNSVAREALSEWLRERGDSTDPEDAASGLWLSRTGSVLTARAVDLVIRRVAADAGVNVSAHVLRHTFVTNLVRSGADVVLVAELAGHRRLDTTRRYSLPSRTDRDAAVEAVLGGR